MSAPEIAALLVLAFGVMLGSLIADWWFAVIVTLALLAIAATFEWRRRN